MRTFSTTFLAIFLANVAIAANLTVITHDSFSLNKDLIKRFEKENNTTISFIKAGDAGQMINRLILTKNAPLADVVYGIDNVLTYKAAKANILESYKSPILKQIETKYDFYPGLITPINYGYININFDPKKIKNIPKNLSDFARPEYKNQLVVQNPATSSPGLAFLLATVQAFGEANYLKFWQSLRDNGLKVTNGWSDAYNVNFSINSGNYPFVVSYTTSPAAEAFYKKLSIPPSKNLFLPNASVLQIEGAAIIKGTKQKLLAEKFIDFLLSKEIQENIPTEMWVYPVNSQAKLADIFKFAPKPSAANEIRLKTQFVQQAEKYIKDWTKVVIQGTKLK